MPVAFAGFTRLCRSIRVVTPTAGSLLAILALSTPATAQAERSELPGKESFAGLSALIGEWSMTGVTAAGQEGVPGGRFFTARQQIDWIEPGLSLGVEWSVNLDDGIGIASGRGRIAWDDIAGAIVNTYRGEEAGRRFSGNATLIAEESGDTMFDWRGHETGGTSDSVNFEVTYIFPDQNTFLVDFIPTCLDGDAGPEPSRFSWKRVNRFDVAMPLATELLGEWTLQSGGSEFIPDGSRLVIRRGRGGNSLSVTGLEAGDAGAFLFSEVIWMDPATAELGNRWVGADGTMLSGSPSVVTRNGRPSFRVEWTIDGPPVDGSSTEDTLPISWLTVDGDRMDVSYTTGLSSDVEDDSASSLPSPMVWERLAP